MTHRLSVLGPSVAMILAAASTVACAQPRMERAIAAASARAEKGAAEPQSGEVLQGIDKATTAIPADPGSAVLGDAKTRQHYLEAMQRYYDYRADGYAYRSRVFEWQLFSSRVIFIVVLLLVGMGIYFAAVQFRAAMRASVRQVADVDTVAMPSAPPLTTQFELSAKGIVVNSSVMGVIILALSLAFFYLYLVYVYPITDVL